MIRAAARSLLSLTVSLGLILAPVQGPLRAAPISKADYEACQMADEATFKRAIEVVVDASLRNGLSKFDYASAVQTEWRKQGLDEVLDKRVDLAVEEVKAQTSWSGLAKSLVSKEKAQELATQVAERVYTSDAVKQAVEGLAAGIGKEIGKTLEVASQDAAGPALECLRLFLGPRYGSTVAGVVSGDVERDFALDASKGGAAVSPGAVLQSSSEGITGAAILLVRRQLANLTTRLGQRLVGSVLSRLVSVVAGGVGLVLIAKDIWDLRNGVLPIIADEMKSEATKESVKTELAKSLSEQIGEHVSDIASKSASHIVEVWQGFRTAHQQALGIAERNPDFRRFIDTLKADQLVRLDEVTQLVLKSDGEPGLLKRLENGSLNEAVRFLGEPAMTIARDTSSIDDALGWSQLASDRIDKILDYEIYRVTKPESFTRQGLSKLLALEDHVAVRRLAALPQDARTTLIETGSVDVKGLARNFSTGELSTLASYLTGLSKEPKERVLKAVAETPGKMQILGSQRVRDGVIQSPDQSAAVNLMLRDGAGDFATIGQDFEAAWEGQIAPVLIWEKHYVLVLAGGFVLLLLLLMMRRLFSGRPKATAA